MMHKKGIDNKMASFLLSIIGIANLISRLGFGAMLDHPKVIAIVINTISMMVTGLTFAVLPLCSDFESFAAIGAIYGLFAGGYVISQPIILADIFGVQSLTSSLGRCCERRSSNY